MKGVYIHIPFCKSRCAYCDFFSTTQLERREEYVQALLREIAARVPDNEPIDTIYFGGGTPSILETKQIERLLNALLKKSTTPPQEITLEANPGDLNLEKLTALKRLGINRLSIGIQSFNDAELRLIGRRHNAAQAIQAVNDAQTAGFDNISIDLIYALPEQTMESWRETIHTALLLGVQHISCYCLSYEDGTPLTRLLDDGKISRTDEDTENKLYDELCEILTANGFIHYEVSNFALPNRQSKHNSSYWNNTPYIGLGAGAHSYDGQTRRWNIADLAAYVRRILSDSKYWDEESLTEEQKAIEHIMLGLRTREGITLTEELKPKAQPLIEQGLLNQTDTNITATQSGLHILNRLIEQLI